MDQPPLFLNDVRTAFVDHSNHARDQTLVPGMMRAERTTVSPSSIINPLLTLAPSAKARRATRLRASHEKHNLVVTHLLCFIERDKYAVGYVEIPQAVGYLDVLQHGPAQHANLAIKLLRDVEHVWRR